MRVLGTAGHRVFRWNDDVDDGDDAALPRSLDAVAYTVFARRYSLITYTLIYITKGAYASCGSLIVETCPFIPIRIVFIYRPGFSVLCSSYSYSESVVPVSVLVKRCEFACHIFWNINFKHFIFRNLSAVDDKCFPPYSLQKEDRRGKMAACTTPLKDLPKVPDTLKTQLEGFNHEQMKPTSTQEKNVLPSAAGTCFSRVILNHRHYIGIQFSNIQSCVRIFVSFKHTLKYSAFDVRRSLSRCTDGLRSVFIYCTYSIR